MADRVEEVRPFVPERVLSFAAAEPCQKAPLRRQSTLGVSLGHSCYLGGPSDEPSGNPFDGAPSNGMLLQSFEAAKRDDPAEQCPTISAMLSIF